MLRSLSYTLAILSLITLGACGGGGGDSTQPGPGSGTGSQGSGSGQTLGSAAGTVAIGAPLAGAVITVLGANGTVGTTKADEQGSYVFPDGVTAPVILRAVGSAGGKPFVLYSAWGALPTTQTHININPLTDVILRQAFKGAAAIESKLTSHAGLSGDESNRIGGAAAQLQLQLGPMVFDSGLMTPQQFAVDANPFVGVMKADKSNPLDVLLESLLVRCADDACLSYDVNAKFDPTYSQRITPAQGAPSAPLLSNAEKQNLALFKQSLQDIDRLAAAQSPAGSAAVVVGCDPQQSAMTCEVAYSSSAGQKTMWVRYDASAKRWNVAPAGTYTNPLQGKF